jgi:hypothetical protein
MSTRNTDASLRTAAKKNATLYLFNQARTNAVNAGQTVATEQTKQQRASVLLERNLGCSDAANFADLPNSYPFNPPAGHTGN